jgi:MoaA/NifB/PqqE/SkfB family radical SAM enzyme
MVHKPLGLLAELTHRCPLGCPYCSNPLALDAREDELDTTTWLRVFREAAQLGVLQVHLSGGEPGARRDLVDIAAGAHAASLFCEMQMHLSTSVSDPKPDGIFGRDNYPAPVLQFGSERTNLARLRTPCNFFSTPKFVT